MQSGGDAFMIIVNILPPKKLILAKQAMPFRAINTNGQTNYILITSLLLGAYVKILLCARPR